MPSTTLAPLARVAGCIAVITLAGRLGAQTNPAMSEPDRFMWEVFAELNKAGGNGSNDVVWETWASATELFGDPNATPVWPSQEAPRGKVLEDDLRQQRLLQFHLQSAGHAPAGLPEFAGTPSEVRINKALFDFVVKEQLWYVEGQEAAFDRGTPIDAPVASREIKAVWKPIPPSQKARYHWQPFNGQVVGLVALHVITKDIPGWTWATWEHIDNPDRCRYHACRDAFGVTADGKVSPSLQALFAKAGLGGEWENYRLVGTQMGFTDLTGRPIVLGNSVVERGFVARSSCMTCHSRSTIGPRLGTAGDANRLEVFPAEIGTPSPDWYENATTSPPTTNYLQLDFVWSFLRAQRRSAPVESATGLSKPTGVEVPTADRRPALPFPPGIRPESICGEIDDLQDVERYDGKLGVTVAYVAAHQVNTVQLQWVSEDVIAQKLPDHAFGNVAGARWCTGTLVSDRLVLTAGHCFEPQGGATGWTTPFAMVPVGADTKRVPATPAQLATLQVAHFQFQVDGVGHLRTPVTYPVVALREHERQGLDYALVELGPGPDGKLPGDAFAPAAVLAREPVVGELAAILQHPAGLPKKVGAGKILKVLGSEVWYSDIDTMGGSSGSGVRDAEGKLVAVHTNGGCNTDGGNRGVSTKAIAAASDVL